MTLRSQIRNFDSQVTSWISATFAHNSWRKLFSFVTGLGDPITIVILASGIMAVGLYNKNPLLVISGAIVPVTVAVGAAVKLLVERARPINEYSEKLGTFSFPSGHSTGSMVAFGLLAYSAFVKLPGVWGVIVATILLLVPIAVGVSRVRLGAHYPSDVLAGWVLGLLALLVIIFVLRPF